MRKSLIYSTRKAFLELALVKLVYKFDEKSTASVRKGESTTMIFKRFGGHIHVLIIYIYKMDTNTYHLTPARAGVCRVTNKTSLLDYCLYSLLYPVVVVSQLVHHSIRHQMSIIG